MLLAQRSGAPVFAGADRYRAGLLAEQDKPSTRRSLCICWTMGFSIWQLARNVDIVLLTKEDMEDTLLPAGNLREPLAAMAEADVVVVREEEAEALTRTSCRRCVRRAMALTVWVIRRTLSLGEWGRSRCRRLPLAFCGIARPENFSTMLKGAGYEPLETVAFPDHHAYDERGYGSAAGAGADSVVRMGL